MSLLASVRKSLVPVHPEGYLFIAIGVVATVVLARFWGPFGWIGTILTLWVAYFFRDPRRTTPLRDGLVVSPADGRISDVSLVIAPAELGLGEVPLRRVSVFMNVFDCHVNRAPVPGRIARMIYRPGKFINAELDKASEDNERSGLVIEGPRGAVGVVQIAGLIARRIVPFVKQGDLVAAGERFGLIRFGSRVDVYLPDTAQLLVGVGQTAVAGETILADLAAGANGPIEFRAA